MKNIFNPGTLLLTALCFCPVVFAQTPGGEWPSYNYNYEGQRFSPLDQINVDNASQLGQVCKIQVDGPTSLHSGLVVSDGVIYIATSRQTLALDALTCDVHWEYTYTPEDPLCGGANRGVALHNGRVFRGTCDGRLIALDARTGELLWKNVIAAPRLGEATSSAPLAWGNKVFMGIAGSDVGARGRVMAFDAMTGDEIWRFNTVPMGDEIGADTWLIPETAKTGGGGVWGAMSLDVSTGELFVPVGNPWPDLDPSVRPGDNLFTDSIVILDAQTGTLKWWHQVAPADWLDYDLAAAPALYRVGSTDYMAIGGKDGYLTVVSRDTQEMVFRTPVTTIDNPYDGPSRETMRICPGIAGGVEWNGPALDQVNGNLIVGAVDICFVMTLEDSEYTPGEINFGGTLAPDGDSTGWITAVNQVTGEISWEYHTDYPVVAGITPTRGGVTFAGDLGGNFYVFDSENGDILHTEDVGGAMAGGVATYEIAGKQYIAMAAGNISRNAYGDVGLPSIVIMTLDPQAPPRTLDITANREAASARQLYSQVCSSCHGVDGNFIADHRLGDLASRMSLNEAIEKVKNPTAPMPALYPAVIDEATAEAVARFVYEEL